MNFLADENVDRQVVDTINKHGTELPNAFSVVTIGAIRIRREID